MRFQTALLASATLLGLTLAARASTITYTLANAAVPQGFTVTGTFNVDSTTFQLSSATLTFNDAALGNPVFNKVNSASAGFNSDFAYIVTSSGSTSGQIFLDYSNIGGVLKLCTTATPCAGSNGNSYVQIYSPSFNGGNPDAFSAGSISPAAAATPEPSSLILLGTGLLGVAGAARRRFLKA